MRILVAVLLASLALPFGAAADEKKDERGRPNRDLFGADLHPYVEFNSDRVSGETAQWTNGASAGADLDLDPFWIGVGYTIHDILSDVQVVPFDGTAYAKLGLYQGGIGHLGSVPSFIHFALVLAVPTGPDKLSLGVETGVEFDVKPLYAGLRYVRRDTWVDDDEEVYPWDNEFGVQLGLYW